MRFLIFPATCVAHKQATVCFSEKRKVMAVGRRQMNKKNGPPVGHNKFFMKHEYLAVSANEYHVFKYYARLFYHVFEY
jgi:hypothetical protein